MAAASGWSASSRHVPCSHAHITCSHTFTLYDRTDPLLRRRLHRARSAPTARRSPASFKAGPSLSTHEAAAGLTHVVRQPAATQCGESGVQGLAAEQNGIVQGDQILAVDGAPTAQRTPFDTASLIASPETGPQGGSGGLVQLQVLGLDGSIREVHTVLILHLLGVAVWFCLRHLAGVAFVRSDRLDVFEASCRPCWARTLQALRLFTMAVWFCLVCLISERLYSSAARWKARAAPPLQPVCGDCVF